MSDVKDLYAQNQPQSGGLFLKTEPGKTYRLRILDLPAVYTSDFEGKKSTKYAWPVYNHDDEEVQILNKGAQVMTAINALIQDDDWGDPANYDIKLTHTGSGMDTKYSVSPSPKSLDVPEDVEVPDVAGILNKNPNNSDVRKLGEQARPKDVVIEDIDDAPIDLEEIPFN